MNKSDSIAKLSLALSKAQGMIKGALRDSANPFFKSKYADLESVWDACREPLSKNELAVIQLADETEKGIIVETVLAHSSGEWISGRMFIPIAKIDAQTVGSACTYARRYSLQMIVGIAPVDDDGNAAANKSTTKEPARITADQNRMLRTLLTSNHIDPAAFKQHFGIETSTDLRADQMDAAKKWIDDIIKNNSQEEA